MGRENTMMMNMVILMWDRAGGLYREMIRCSAPPVSIKDRSLQGRLWSWLVILATYSGKPDIPAIPLWERTTAHWEWRDSESSVYPPYWNGVGRWSTVLSGGANPFLFWRIRVKVDICRSGTCICHVVGNPQLGLIGSMEKRWRDGNEMWCLMQVIDIVQVQTGYYR
jgi:hypothetical protein